MDPDAGVMCLVIPSGTTWAMPIGMQFADFVDQHNYVHWATAVDNMFWDDTDPNYGSHPSGWWTLYDDVIHSWKWGTGCYTGAQTPTLLRVTSENGLWTSQVSEDTQGKGILNLYLSGFKRGIRYTSIFQLLDDDGGAPDPMPPACSMRIIRRRRRRLMFTI